MTHNLVLSLILGAECPSCGRDNSGYANVCTCEDCPGVITYNAAPDLLDALANLLKMVEDGDYTTIELNEARAAIAKAEGA